MQVICNMFKALLETTAALTRFTQKTNYFCYSLCRYLCGVALVQKKNVARTNNTTLIKPGKYCVNSSNDTIPCLNHFK